MGAVVGVASEARMSELVMRGGRRREAAALDGAEGGFAEESVRRRSLPTKGGVTGPPAPTAPAKLLASFEPVGEMPSSSSPVPGTRTCPELPLPRELPLPPRVRLEGTVPFPLPIPSSLASSTVGDQGLLGYTPDGLIGPPPVRSAARGWCGWDASELGCVSERGEEAEGSLEVAKDEIDNESPGGPSPVPRAREKLLVGWVIPPALNSSAPAPHRSVP